METEHTGVGEQRDLLNAVHVLLKGIVILHLVVVTSLREVELLVGVEDEISAEFFEVAHHYTSIEVVGDTATVHSFSDKVTQGFPRKLFISVFLGLVHVQGNEGEGNLEVRLVEVVLNVPANLSELLSLLDGSVEERQHVYQRAELRLIRLQEVFLSETRVDLSEIGTKTIWGLSDDLKGFLKDTEGETVSWLGGEPQSEVLVRLLEVLNDGLHFLEPRDEQMAIVEHDPVTTDGSAFDHFLGGLFGSLTQGQELELALAEAQVVSQSLHFSLRISSRR